MCMRRCCLNTAVLRLSNGRLRMVKRKLVSPRCGLMKVSILEIFCCRNECRFCRSKLQWMLSPVLAEVGAELMVRTLAGLEDGTLHATPQDSAHATLAPILQREDGRIDWNRTAQQIYDRWRGFQPWPGAFTSFRGKKLILHAMKLGADSPGSGSAPGTLRRTGNRLLVACGEGTWLDLLELQMEGKRRMPVEAFLNGLSLADGEQLDPR